MVGRVPGDEAVRLHVSGDDRAGAHNGAAADPNSRKHNDPASEPNVVLDENRFDSLRIPGDAVVVSVQDDAVPGDPAPAANRNMLGRVNFRTVADGRKIPDFEQGWTVRAGTLEIQLDTLPKNAPAGADVSVLLSDVNPAAHLNPAAPFEAMTIRKASEIVRGLMKTLAQAGLVDFLVESHVIPVVKTTVE